MVYIIWWVKTLSRWNHLTHTKIWWSDWNETMTYPFTTWNVNFKMEPLAKMKCSYLSIKGIFLMINIYCPKHMYLRYVFSIYSADGFHLYLKITFFVSFCLKICKQIFGSFWSSQHPYIEVNKQHVVHF